MEPSLRDWENMLRAVPPVGFGRLQWSPVLGTGKTTKVYTTRLPQNRLQWSPVLGTGKTGVAGRLPTPKELLQWSPVLGTGKTWLRQLLYWDPLFAAMEPSLRDWENLPQGYGYVFR